MLAPLIAAAQAPLEVRVVQEDEALHLLLSIGGPVLIALAAVFAAVIAARTANRRQQKQLDHDFEVRRREYVRHVLDSTVEDAQEMLDSETGLEMAIANLERRRPELLLKIEEGDADEQAGAALHSLLVEAREAHAKARDDVLKMHGSGLRLNLALGIRHRISLAYLELRKLTSEALDLLSEGITENRTDEQIEASTSKEAAVGDAFAAFMTLSQNWLAERPAIDAEEPI
jgi:hypothetical protein